MRRIEFLFPFHRHHLHYKSNKTTYVRDCDTENCNFDFEFKVKRTTEIQLKKEIIRLICEAFSYCKFRIDCAQSVHRCHCSCGNPKSKWIDRLRFNAHNFSLHMHYDAHFLCEFVWRSLRLSMRTNPDFSFINDVYSIFDRKQQEAFVSFLDLHSAFFSLLIHSNAMFTHNDVTWCRTKTRLSFIKTQVGEKEVERNENSGCG